MAAYELANPIAKVSPDGAIEAEQSGETTVLVRYLDQQIPARLIFVPERPGFAWSNPKAGNYVDELIYAKLRTIKVNPSPGCSDETFARRAYLDLLGLIPTAEEARAFALDLSPGKRSRLVDELLRRPEFADFWALKWSDLLRTEERVLDRKGVELFHDWVRQSIEQGKPIDQFARELVSARGSSYLNPAANYYRANRTPVSRAEAAAQVFLGRRLQCAQCHNHPFDRWTQDDYYDWTALFSRVQYKVLENRRRDSNDGHEFKGEQIVYLGKAEEVRNPRTGKKPRPRFLGASTPIESGAEGEDELQALAQWLTSPENPFFARVQANRIWFHLMGRGIVDPVDDFRASNPASHPELLEALARDFREHGYDLRHLIRVIMNSAAYQASSEPNETNLGDEMNYSRNIVRRLSAEQLLDAKSAALQAPLKLTGYPAGVRAAQMAGALTEKKRDQRQTEFDTFLAEFGKPPRLLTSECERNGEPTMGQAFQMISGPALQELLEAPGNKIARVAALEPAAAITDLFWSALSRGPSPAEMAKFTSYLKERESAKKEALEDIAWSLINSKEFLLRH
jgi:hypothetical protein